MQTYRNIMHKPSRTNDLILPGHMELAVRGAVDLEISRGFVHSLIRTYVVTR
jgi:hypothetical protein